MPTAPQAPSIAASGSPLAATMDNMIKQWHSIERVWGAMERSGTRYERVGLFRLDVRYKDPIDIGHGAAMVPAFHSELPRWVNDRMFFGEYRYARQWATGRFPHAAAYVVENNFMCAESLNNKSIEKLLGHLSRAEKAAQDNGRAFK